VDTDCRKSRLSSKGNKPRSTSRTYLKYVGSVSSRGRNDEEKTYISTRICVCVLLIPSFSTNPKDKIQGRDWVETCFRVGLANIGEALM
jgi:hypothetical protein